MDAVPSHASSPLVLLHFLERAFSHPRRSLRSRFVLAPWLDPGGGASHARSIDTFYERHAWMVGLAYSPPWTCLFGLHRICPFQVATVMFFWIGVASPPEAASGVGRDGGTHPTSGSSIGFRPCHLRHPRASCIFLPATFPSSVFVQGAFHSCDGAAAFPFSEEVFVEVRFAVAFVGGHVFSYGGEIFPAFDVLPSHASAAFFPPAWRTAPFFRVGFRLRLSMARKEGHGQGHRSTFLSSRLGASFSTSCTCGRFLFQRSIVPRHRSRRAKVRHRRCTDASILVRIRRVPTRIGFLSPGILPRGRDRVLDGWGTSIHGKRQVDQVGSWSNRRKRCVWCIERVPATPSHTHTHKRAT